MFVPMDNLSSDVSSSTAPEDKTPESKKTV
jgi:hypothetical protein